MFTNNLCPSCRQIYGESFSFKSSLTLSDFLDTRKCSKCSEIFSTQEHSERVNNVENNFNVENVPYFNGSSLCTNNTYEPGPLDMEYFQRYLGDGDNYNNVENVPNNSVPDESLNFSSVPITDGQDFNLEGESSLMEFIASKFNLDNFYPDTSVLESLGSEKSLEESESSLTNLTNLTNFAAEIQSNYQQLAIESNSSIASPDKEGCNDYSAFTDTRVVNENPMEGQPQVTTGSLPTATDAAECNINSIPGEEINSCSEVNLNAMAGQELSNITAEKPAKRKRKMFKFDNEVYPIYSIETHQRVSIDEINAKIAGVFNGGFVGVKNNKFFCRFAADCCKVLTTSAGIREHLFSHLFFFRCTICRQIFHHRLGLGSHLKACQEASNEPITESTGNDQNSADCNTPAADPENIDSQSETKTECESPFWVKSSEWKHPLFKKDTLEEVSIKVIMEKISENYAIYNSQKRYLVCLLNHECHRFYYNAHRLMNHVFAYYYFYRCIECGRKSHCPANIKNHRMVCEGPPEPEMVSEITEQSILGSDGATVDGELINTTENLVNETEETSLTVSEHDITTECRSVASSLDNPEELNESVETDTSTEEEDDIQSGQPTETPAQKRWKAHAKRLYRCPYCEYKCKPGGIRKVMEHLNGRFEDGIIFPPECDARKRLKPIDPKTGLYAQLDLVLQESEKTDHAK